MTLTDAAKKIADAAIQGALPYDNTLSRLKTLAGIRNPTVLAVGKAAVPMAKAAADVFGDRIKNGLLITKYGHAFPDLYVHRPFRRPAGRGELLYRGDPVHQAHPG